MEHPGAKAGDFWLAIGDGASHKTHFLSSAGNDFIFRWDDTEKCALQRQLGLSIIKKYNLV